MDPFAGVDRAMVAGSGESGNGGEETSRSEYGQVCNDLKVLFVPCYE